MNKAEELCHHGILGQKWGIRRFQNADGSLTAAGKQRVYAQGANYGGYESFRHRHRRAIDAAKYDKDIEKNQKKLDRAYEKGNTKKIEKYTAVDKVLKNNRNIMIKDLSPEEIQMGKNYITMMKATAIGTIIAGPIGGAAAGMGVRYANKMQETKKKAYAQEQERRKQFDEAANLRKEAKDYDKKKFEDWSESESDKKWDSYYDKDYEAKKNLEKTKSYYNKRNSFSTDEDKDLWEAQQQATTKKEKDKIINERVKLAKETNQYEMEFLERNLDVDDETGKQLTGKAMDDAYRKYLQKEKNYYK